MLTCTTHIYKYLIEFLLCLPYAHGDIFTLAHKVADLHSKIGAPPSQSNFLHLYTAAGFWPKIDWHLPLGSPRPKPPLKHVITDLCNVSELKNFTVQEPMGKSSEVCTLRDRQ